MVDRNSLRERFSDLSTTELRHVLGSPDYSELAHDVARELLAGRAAEAPSHRCAAHADEEVVGTCARCGAFICRACDPAWARVGRGHCPACQARAARAPSRMSSPVSASGALLLLGAFLFVLRPVLGGPLMSLVGAGLVLAGLASLLLRR